MKDLIVVSYATHRAGLLDEYEQQLKDAKIDFHLEPVELADGINSVTARWKFEYMRRMCEKFENYERIIFTDAWDVLFCGYKREVLRNAPAHMLIGAERNCWPEPWLAKSIVDTTAWPFVNPGLISGSPEGILWWTKQALKLEDLDLLEQQWMNRCRALNWIPMCLDVHTQLFYTVSEDKEHGELQSRAGDPWNRSLRTYPQFFHFSGKCPTEPFRAMLRGETLSL
jgi:hypothetical protein